MDTVSVNRPYFTAIFSTLFLIVFTFTNPYMAAPYIVGDLGGSNTISLYTIALFGVGSALGVPLGKPLLMRWGLCRVLVICILAMALFTTLCGLAPTYPVYLIERFFLGFSVGPLYSAISLSIATFMPQEKREAATSLFVTILAVVPVVGACWGAILAYEFTWRWIYYINIAPLLFLAFFLARQELDAKIEKAPFDTIGYLFFCLGIFSLSFAAMAAQQLDWVRSPLLVALTLIGVPSFLFFLLWSWHHPHPILELRMLKQSHFTFALFNLAILFSAYFGMIGLLSQWLKLYVNYTPIWIMAIVGGTAVAGLLPRLLIEGSLSRINPLYVLSLSIALLSISCFYTCTFNEEINFGRIVFSRIIASFGLALFLPPIFQICFSSFPKEQSIDVLQIFQVVRNLAAGLGVAIYSIVWQRREVFFHERLGEKLNVISTKSFKGTPADLGFFLDRKAISLGLDDVFWLMAWILVALLILVILWIRKK